MYFSSPKCSLFIKQKKGTANRSIVWRCSFAKLFFFFLVFCRRASKFVKKPSETMSRIRGPITLGLFLLGEENWRRQRSNALFELYSQFLKVEECSETRLIYFLIDKGVQFQNFLVDPGPNFSKVYFGAE